jgi:L-asparaginase
MYSQLSVRLLPGHRSRVCLIYTGGTIGSVPTDPATPGSLRLRPASLEDLLEAVPGLGAAEGIELGLVSFHQPVDSAFVSRDHWLALACAIEEHYDAFDGFVVLHGTDTMAYTSSALSFLLNNLAKPVVVTGAQRPIKDRRGDAVMNLMSAIHIAGYRATGLPCIPEVTLCFMDRLLRGNRATKVSAERWQGFESPNFPPLAIIGERIRVHTDLLRPAPQNARYPFYVDKALAEQIRIVYVHPGLTPEQLQRDLNTDGLQGVVMLTYGSGNFPGSERFLEPIRKACVPILNVTQCLEGTVEMRLYQAGGGLLETGVASGDNMTLEAGLAKMYWALARFKPDDVRAQLQISQRGEQGQNLFDLNFDPPEADCEQRAAAAIEPGSQQLHWRYDPAAMKNATLRIRGLGIRQRDPGRPCSFRIFLNRPGASESTPALPPFMAGEYGAERVTRDGVFLAAVTQTMQSIAAAGPTTVTLVGVNADIWCRSIQIALYCEAV